MKKSSFFAALISTVLFSHSAPGQTRLQVVAFYPKWCETSTGSAFYAIEPNDIDWRGINYVVHFWSGENVQSTTAPYLTLLTSSNDSIDAEYNGITNPRCGSSCWAAYQRQLIDSVHAVGGKVLLDIHQVNNSAFLSILPDSSKVETFTYNTVQYLTRKGYDGVCVNVEQWATGGDNTPAEYSRLTRRFQYWLNQMPAGKRIFSYAPSMYYYGDYQAVVDTAVTWGVLQGNFADAWDGTLNSNVNYFYQPLRTPNICPNAGKSSWAEYFPNWINSGHRASKLAPIISSGVESISALINSVEQ